MVNQSKFLSCHQALHHSNPSCNAVGLDIIKKAYVSAAKIYLPLFLIGSLGSRKITDWRYLIFSLVPNVMRSSLFISVIGALWCRLACVLRNLRGQHVPSSYFWSPLIAAWIGISIEKQERRRELCVYVVNQASEAFWRVLESRGLVKRPKFGLSYLFSISFGILLYFQKNEPNILPGSTKTLLKLFVGSESFPDFFEQRVVGLYEKLKRLTLKLIGRKETSSSSGKISRTYSIDSDLYSHGKPTNQVCFHGRGGCIPYISIGFGRSFLLGVVIRILFTFLPLLLTPTKMMKAFPRLFQSQSYKLALFLGLLGGGNRLIQCALRHIRGTEDGLNQFIAGAISGMAFQFMESTEVAFYVASKAAEGIYYMLINRGLIKPLPYGDTLTFSVATGFLFYVSLLEPHNVRPSYRKFLSRASGTWWERIATDFIPVREAFGIPNMAKYQEVIKKLP